jgi:signal transduction histidine kinase
VVLRCTADLECELEVVPLGRLLENLVSNALRASAPGSRVRVTARRRPGSELRIEVRDRGVGMAPDELERCLRPGVSGSGGTGWGTASVIDCVEQLGARLELESEPGWGTRARVYLPIAASARADATLVSAAQSLAPCE